MPLPNPSFVSIRKKECLAVSSWRSVSPEPTKDDSHIVRIGLSSTVTSEQVLAVAARALSREEFDTFHLGPVQTVPTKKKGVDPTAGVSPAVNPMEDDEDADLPEMALPVAASATTPMQCFRVSRESAAIELRKALAQNFSTANVTSASAQNEQQLPTLILKGLPFNIAPDQFLVHLDLLSNRPSHIRLQRGDRGMFKCVAFIKYHSACAAEIAKVELERFTHGHKPVKVEYKKRARRHIPNDPGVEETAHTQLTDLVNELKVSKENEAFTFPKGVLSKEEQKFLKGLCVSVDLIFEAPDAITVRRKTLPPPERSPKPAPSTTPPWHINTPQSLAPRDGLNFRGIRSWKEARESSNFKLGQGLRIKRPLGPGEAAPFGAGRGRPVPPTE